MLFNAFLIKFYSILISQYIFDSRIFEENILIQLR